MVQLHNANIASFRFGEQLRSSMIKEFYWHYIAYEDLKDALKTQFVTEPTPDNPKPDRKPWTEEDEKRFVSLLESELDKVFTFQKIKSEEIIRRIQTSEREVNEGVSRLDAGPGRPDRPTDEDFLLLEADLSDIIADVHDLAKFTQLNYTGFQKIIKKHDVRHPRPEDYPQCANMLRWTETNRVVSQTCLRRPSQRQTLLQGQLRCLCGEVVAPL